MFFSDERSTWGWVGERTGPGMRGGKKYRKKAEGATGNRQGWSGYI